MTYHIKDLETYGIPSMIIQKLTEKGYSEMTAVQEMAVRNGLFEGKSILVSAPTNTGKTFIAELAAMATSKRLGNQRTFYLVPLRALAEEKYLEFKSKYEDYGLKVAISTSDRTEFDDALLDYDVVISTYEKLMALLVRNPSLRNQIGVVVVDELQNLGSESRGVTLEVLLTQLVHFFGEDKPQVIALSATAPNYQELAEWLNAVPITTTKREVDLHEGIQYIGDKVFNFRGFMLEKGSIIFKKHNSGEIGLTKERLLNLNSSYAELGKSEQIIVFALRKKDTSAIAETLALEANLTNNATQWINQLDDRVESTPSTKILKKCIAKGVAFHHAGLLYEERLTVSSAFESGDVKVIVATKTLSEGVNTPAKTVIILPNKFLTVNEYKNMAGRAGRVRAHDSAGKSILIAARPSEVEALWTTYIEQPPQRILSQIPKADIDLQILSLVSVELCTSVEDILSFFEKSYFGHIYYNPAKDEKKKEFDSEIGARVEKLISNGLVQNNNGKLASTELGNRSAQELLTPDSTILFFRTFIKTKSIVEIDPRQYLEGIIHLACCSDNAQKANMLLGVSPLEQERRELISYEKQNHGIFLHIPQNHDLELMCIRTTQMLMRWIDGADYHELSKFAEQGEVRRIAETIGWIIRGMARIVDKPIIDFDEKVIDFLKKLSDRVIFGVKEGVDIAKLRIPGIGRYRAMKLAQSGYTTLNSLMDIETPKLKELGISNSAAVEIKKRCEECISNINKRSFYSQKRRAQFLHKDLTLLDNLYADRGLRFTRACVDIFNEMKLSCAYMEDTTDHDIDALIETSPERISVECKRKDDNNLVSATEAEEVLGKSASYEPVSKVTIGYPDFSDVAIRNCKIAKLSLVTCRKLGDLLVSYWEGVLSTSDIVNLLKSNTYDGKESGTSII